MIDASVFRAQARVYILGRSGISTIVLHLAQRNELTLIDLDQFVVSTTWWKLRGYVELFVFPSTFIGT